MRSRPRVTPIASRGAWCGAVALAALLGPPASGHAQAPDAAARESAARLSLQVERFTGPVDRHCGVYTIADPSDVREQTAVSPRQMRLALRCADKARREGRATWVLWQVRGIDSTLFDGLATSGRSDLHVVHYDSLGPGRLTLEPCLRPRVAKGEIACRNDREPLTPDAFRALAGKVADDLARTIGKDRAAAADRLRAQADAATGATDGDAVTAAVAAVQSAVQADTGQPWPSCPLHYSHALVVRDGHWFCDRDRTFVAAVGRLRKVAPR